MAMVKNYILPKKLGIEASKAVMNEWNIKKSSEMHRKQQEEAEAKKQAADLKGKQVVIRTKSRRRRTPVWIHYHEGRGGSNGSSAEAKNR